MKNTTNSGASRPATSQRLPKRRLAAATAAIALVATGAVGAHSFADDESGTGSTPPAGEQISGEPASAPDADGDLVIGTDEFIQTSGSNFDPTIVSKFIQADGFQTLQGVGSDADTIVRNGSCLSPAATSGGTVTNLYASVELPDGARIKRVGFYGQDNDATDINIGLNRVEVFTPLAILPFTPTSTRTTDSIDSFSTSGTQANASVVFGADNLNELVGTPNTGGILLVGSTNRFHQISVTMRNTAGNNHVLCGVRVDYQIPVPTDPGTVFHPIDSVRAFDSRIASLPQSGRLGPNQTKVIDVTDGYDSTGAAVPAQNNVVPTTATSVAYNITIAGADGPNFVAVTAGDAAAFTASAINYSAGSNVANGSTVTVAADQTIKLWGGNNTGSSHVIIDIVGYYSAPVPSNMAN